MERYVPKMVIPLLFAAGTCRAQPMMPVIKMAKWATTSKPSRLVAQRLSPSLLAAILPAQLRTAMTSCAGELCRRDNNMAVW